VEFEPRQALQPSKKEVDTLHRRSDRVDWFAWLILALAVVAYFLLWRQAPYVTNDWGGYARVAKDIAQHLLPTEIHFRTPGYPMLLVLTGSTDVPSRALFLLQLLLHVTAVFLVVDLLRKLGFSRWVQRGCLLLMVLPPFIEPAAYALTESACAFLLSVTIWLIARKEWGYWSAVGSGFAAGLAALTRPGYQLLGLALALVMLAIGQWRRAIVLALVFLATVGSLILYNGARFGYPSITSATGWNLSTRTAMFLDEWSDGRTKEYWVFASLCG